MAPKSSACSPTYTARIYAKLALAAVVTLSARHCLTGTPAGWKSAALRIARNSHGLKPPSLARLN
jgi:hypothetical protein